MSEDFTCYGCGYDLAALSEDGVCPECGTSIAQSRASGTLELADPEWLRRTHSGLAWLVATFALRIVLGLMVLIPGVYLVVDDWMIYVLVFSDLAAFAMAGIRLTVRDPAVIVVSGHQPERRARVLILSYVAMTGSSYIWWPAFGSNSVIAYTIAGATWTLMYVAGMAYLLIHLRRITIRAQETRSGDRLRRLIIWFALAVIAEETATAPVMYSLHYLIVEIGHWVFGAMQLCVYVGLIRAVIKLREALGSWIEKVSILEAASAMSGPDEEIPPST